MKPIISSTSGEPIYEQIKNQIRSAILSGELTDGETLPSLRTLARELHVSVLTITRSYGELADEGLVENVQGKGTFVKAHGNELIKERARERIMQVLRQTVTAAKAADIELIDLLSMFEGLQGTVMNDALPLAWRGLRMFGPRGRNRTLSVQSRRGAS